MERLYKTKLLDENTWEFNFLRTENVDDYLLHTYELFNNKTNEGYVIPKATGFEQLTDDEFFIFRRIGGGYFEIQRLKLNNGETKILFKKNFSNFELIDEDRMLFNYWDSSCNGYIFDGVYSISQSNLYNHALWLQKLNFETIRDNDNNIDKLLFKEDIHVNKDVYKLIFTVDPNTFNPTECYSSLRDKFFEIKLPEEYIEIKNSDERYAEIMSNILTQNEIDQENKVKEKLLNRNA